MLRGGDVRRLGNPAGAPSPRLTPDRSLARQAGAPRRKENRRQHRQHRKKRLRSKLRRGFEETQALAERVASVRRNLATTSWDTAAEHFACPLMDVYGKLKHEEEKSDT